MALNGRLPSSSLGLLITGHLIRKDLISQTEALRQAFQSRFKKPLLLTGGYRTYATQERIFRERYTTTPISSPDVRWWNGIRWYRKPGFASAAVPGTSNHGLGTAIDFSSNVNNGGSAEHSWMVAHGPAFGWNWPTWARKSPTYEPWHFESPGIVPVGNYIGIPGVNIPNIPPLPPAPPYLEDFLSALTDQEQRRLLAWADNGQARLEQVYNAILTMLPHVRDRLPLIHSRADVGAAEHTNILNGVLGVLAALRDLPSVDEKALAEELAPLISESIYSLSDVDLNRIARAVTDEQARRLTA